MIKRIACLLFTFLLISLCFFGIAKAQAGDPASLQESIDTFNSIITVNVDNSVDVTETITYNTGPQERHGIFRNIYPYSSTGKKMSIENVSVEDKNNNPYIFQVSNSGQDIRIKIGDPDKTFTGQKIYVVKYHATKAIAQYQDFDEIYWNVTGNEWQMPIFSASASVLLPGATIATQSACYFGPKSSTEQCQLKNNQNGIYNFDAPSTLLNGEGLTVAVGFPKGVVAAYTNTDKVAGFFDMYSVWLLAGILPILTLILSLWYWYKKGRDPKGTGVVVAEYDVPDNLTPMEVAGIVNQIVTAENISAEIIYLATQGYLRIAQTEERTLGIFKSTDYELSKLKDFSDLPNEFDQKLLNALFNSDVGVIKLSELKNVFYKNVGPITTAVMDALFGKSYYKNLGSKAAKIYAIIIPIMVALLALSRFFIFDANILPIFLSLIVSIIIYNIISRFFPAKTEKGVAAKEYILGLKDYLQIAEKDRLIFHDAPEKKPEIFEKLLPYAMVLGVANIWAKEFEGIYTTPPSWYYGPNNGAFNAVIFTHSLSHFSSFASSSMSSSPSGSGSGGGGFSGGGGGGGGGGGW
jgi:uncharacterized membrane protein